MEGRLTVGNLLGTRMVLNEFVAFVKLGEPAIRGRSTRAAW